jgi:hypothetical protein
MYAPHQAPARDNPMRKLGLEGQAELQAVHVADDELGRGPDT